MARMYSRKKGKSGSTKPSVPKKTTWVTYKPKEVEMIITKMAKEGKNPASIGLVLRDTYGIPSAKVMLKKSIKQFMAEKEILQKVPEDILSLIRRTIELLKHIENNKQDQTAKRGLTLTESKIRRLTDYYKRTGELKSEWNYNRDSAGMFAE
ncbi:MAG: 30S ribosomal protein S15 [Nanoarchaeota archaeon]|nr:30S ribosomal protein S15 [Nanoarchaeota archaeon]